MLDQTKMSRVKILTVHHCHVVIPFPPDRSMTIDIHLAGSAKKPPIFRHSKGYHTKPWQSDMCRAVIRYRFLAPCRPTQQSRLNRKTIEIESFAIGEFSVFFFLLTRVNTHSYAPLLGFALIAFSRCGGKIWEEQTEKSRWTFLESVHQPARSFLDGFWEWEKKLNDTAKSGSEGTSLARCWRTWVIVLSFDGLGSIDFLDVFWWWKIFYD